MRTYREEDLEIGLPQDRVAIIGYGNQGHAHAQNLRDSGFEVTVGAREGGPSWSKATEDGFSVAPIHEAVSAGGSIMMSLPDTQMPKVYQESIGPHLLSGSNLMVCHGYNFHFGHIPAAEGIDITMVAPSGPGASLRSSYLQGFGLPCLVAVHKDSTGTAEMRALHYAHGLGCFRAAVLGSTIQEETESDLFGEQVVLCGGLLGLVRGGFETLVKAGFPPEVAYFECVHQVVLLANLVQRGGFTGMFGAISDTAEWGAYQVADRVIGQESREAMKEVLRDIQSGEFDRGWQQELRDGLQTKAALFDKVSDHEMEQVGARLRAAMPFLSAPNTKG